MRSNKSTPAKISKGTIAVPDKHDRFFIVMQVRGVKQTKQGDLIAGKNDRAHPDTIRAWSKSQQKLTGRIKTQAVYTTLQSDATPQTPPIACNQEPNPAVGKSIVRIGNHPAISWA
jgi:hypothetical protein